MLFKNTVSWKNCATKLLIPAGLAIVLLKVPYMQHSNNGILADHWNLRHSWGSETRILPELEPDKSSSHVNVSDWIREKNSTDPPRVLKLCKNMPYQFVAQMKPLGTLPRPGTFSWHAGLCRTWFKQVLEKVSYTLDDGATKNMPEMKARCWIGK